MHCHLTTHSKILISTSETYNEWLPMQRSNSSTLKYGNWKFRCTKSYYKLHSCFPFTVCMKLLNQDFTLLTSESGFYSITLLEFYSINNYKISSLIPIGWFDMFYTWARPRYIAVSCLWFVILFSFLFVVKFDDIRIMETSYLPTSMI